MFHLVLPSVVLALAVLVAAPVAHADVTVTYIAPERFRDREFRNSHKRALALAEFDREFEELGSRYLPDGSDLAVEVLDIDLAGDFEPWDFDYRDVRIMRETTPPRMHLRYVLSEGGRVLARDEVRITNMRYLSDPRANRLNGRFSHDMRLLGDWFRKTFFRPADRAAATPGT
ncbi:Protein of unknown function [Paracoccus halophilus]|uniref:DUF3016 domain-containing protein n=1 Tax=Paracoccus halophilus TaxID=376733 RepID=A0A1I0UBD8_9RHOB|nr:DUF3016 domain-containing protein [Paracoccus halophilus]SFA61117.1 Protein of unknown function [Paracoccus halophilus]